jgi:hypothetical protein
MEKMGKPTITPTAMRRVAFQEAFMGTLRVWFNSNDGQDGCTGFYIYRMKAFFFDLSQIPVVKIRFLASDNNIHARI